MKEKSTETGTESRPAWESLEALARQGVQRLLRAGMATASGPGSVGPSESTREGGAPAFRPGRGLRLLVRDASDRPGSRRRGWRGRPRSVHHRGGRGPGARDLRRLPPVGGSQLEEGRVSGPDRDRKEPRAGARPAPAATAPSVTGSCLLVSPSVSPFVAKPWPRRPFEGAPETRSPRKWLIFRGPCGCGGRI